MGRSREAWLTAFAAVLGVSPAACHKDSAREDPARAVEVPFASASASASVVAVASAAPSASVSTSAAAKPAAPPVDSASPFMAQQIHASCGATACGGSANCGATAVGPTAKPPAAPPPQIAATLSGNTVGKDPAALTAIRPGLVACGRTALGLNPAEHGTVTFELSIGADGNVSAATAKQTQSLSSADTACMAAQMKRGAFEATGVSRTLFALVVLRPPP